MHTPGRRWLQVSRCGVDAPDCAVNTPIGPSTTTATSTPATLAKGGTQHTHTRVSLNREVECELSPKLGPVQNQIFYSRGPAGTMRTNVSFLQAYHENPQDIAVNIFSYSCLLLRRGPISSIVTVFVSSIFHSLVFENDKNHIYYTKNAREKN